MPWYELAKIVHFLGLIAFAGAFVIYPRAGARLRSATTYSEVRGWLGLLELTRGMMHGGAAMMLVSGAAMAAMRWRAPYPFVAIGMATLLVVWLLFALIPSRHLQSIREMLGSGDAQIFPEVAQAIHQPRPWIVMFVLNLAVLGVLFEMTLKLGWLGGTAIVAVAAALGALAGSAVLRRERSLSGPRRSRP